MFFALIFFGGRRKLPEFQERVCLNGSQNFVGSSKISRGSKVFRLSSVSLRLSNVHYLSIVVEGRVNSRRVICLPVATIFAWTCYWSSVWLPQLLLAYSQKWERCERNWRRSFSSSARGWMAVLRWCRRQRTQHSTCNRFFWSPEVPYCLTSGSAGQQSSL